MKLTKKGEAGQIFVLVLILLAMGPLLVVPMLRLSYSSQRYNQVTEIITLNTYAADSGIEWGKYQVYNYPLEIMDASPPGLEWNLVINNIDVHVTVEYDRDMAVYVITSTATRAERSLTIESNIVIDVGLFGNIVASDGDLTIDECEFVNEDFPGESDVFTNGNISLKGSASFPTIIDGDVTASGTITVGQHSEVTGTIEEGADEIEFPPIDEEVHEEKAKATNDIRGHVTLGPGTHSLGPTYIDGNLSIEGHPVQGNAKVTLEGTVYVTGTITIDLAELYGFGDILAEGDISIRQTTFGLDIGDYLPLLFSVYGDISISGSEAFRPFVQSIMYAPAPDSQLSLAWVDAFGSVAAESIYLHRSTLEYPADLRGRADLPGAGLDTVTYTYE